MPTCPVKWTSSTCRALSLWATFCRRAKQGRRGSWSRSWSMSCCSSSSSTFTWWSTTPTDPWKAYSLTSRWAAGELLVLLINSNNLSNPFITCSWLPSPQTRYPALENPESLRKSADDFLTQAAMTDAGLLFPPSQIALTAILYSASRAGLNMERYNKEHFSIWALRVEFVVI